MCEKTTDSHAIPGRGRGFEYADAPNQTQGQNAPNQTQGQIAGIGCCLSDEEKLDQIFKYHPPNPSTGPKFETLREAARHFAKVILMNVPPGADRSAAIRKVREAVMTANAGVSLNGLNL